jgi:hypothetical protein
MGRKFDHLSDVEVFLNVVEHGSFSAAAIVLSTTPSVLSRAVSRLEGRLGVQLLRRTTRSLSLTDAASATPTKRAAPSPGSSRPSRRCAARRRS